MQRVGSGSIKAIHKRRSALSSDSDSIAVPFCTRSREIACGSLEQAFDPVSANQLDAFRSIASLCNWSLAAMPAP
jgi:hypothetical protein